jgi:hypothetical protein
VEIRQVAKVYRAGPRGRESVVVVVDVAVVGAVIIAVIIAAVERRG